MRSLLATSFISPQMLLLFSSNSAVPDKGNTWTNGEIIF